MAERYWDRYWRARVSRRRVLAGGAATAAGAAALVAVGCGDDDDDATATPAEPAATATAAATQAATATVAPTATATPTPAPTPTEDAGPRGGTFRMQHALASTGYDPAVTVTGRGWSALTYNHILGYSLVEDESWGDAAASWEQPDPLTLVFSLEPNLRFNPEAAGGRQIVSTDIAASFSRFPDAVANLGSRLNPLQYFWMAGFETPDDLTFGINLPHPWASALPTLGSSSLAIVAPEAVEANGDLRDTVNGGGGAYMFETADPDGTDVYVRNPNYAGHSTARGRFTAEPPWIDRWEDTLVTDPVARETRFLAGDTDVLEGVTGGLEILKINELREREGVRIIEGPTNKHLIMALDALKWARFPMLREALSLAIDWDGYIDVVLDGEGIRGAPVGPAFPQVLPQEEIRQLQQFDPERARQLWEQGGGDQVFPDGFVTVIPTFTTGIAQQFIAQSIEENLGVPTRLEPADLANFIALATAPPGQKIWHWFVLFEDSVSTIPDYNALTHYVPTGYGGAFGLFTHDHPLASQIPPEVIDITDPVGAPIQQLYNAQGATLDPEARAGYLQQLQRLIFTQFCCTLPLPVESVDRFAISDRLREVPPVPDFFSNAAMGYRRAQNMWLADA